VITSSDIVSIPIGILFAMLFEIDLAAADSRGWHSGGSRDRASCKQKCTAFQSDGNKGQRLARVPGTPRYRLPETTPLFSASTFKAGCDEPFIKGI
jgi:hypothetical protein